MDRTKEFLSIVEHIEIPQNPFTETNFFIDLRKIEEEIELALVSLSKLTSYELFKTPGLISKVTDLLKEYKSYPIIIDSASLDCQNMLSNFDSMRNTRYLKYMLRLKDVKRRFQRAEPEVKDSAESPTGNTRGNTGAGGLLSMTVQKVEQDNELIEERRRMQKSINEMGQVVENISLHVRLQEEELKRIDSILLDSDKWSRRALNELNEMWFNVKSNRKAMVKFFIFWMVVILFFWGLRKL